MSYNIGILEIPLPEDFEEACAIFDGIANKEEEVNEVHPKYQAFFDEIVKIYPCICDLPEDLEDDGVWCDGPLINNFKTNAPVIGFVYSKVEEALPIVVEKATKMGLSVLDWQAGAVYQAKGV